VLDGLISPVEPVPALVAVPVSSLESLLSLDYSHYLTVLTTS